MVNILKKYENSMRSMSETPIWQTDDGTVYMQAGLRTHWRV